MTLNHLQPPQTFEEWHSIAGAGRSVYEMQIARSGWDAGVASQQAEIDILRTELKSIFAGEFYAKTNAQLAEKEAEIERLTYELGEWRQPNMLTEVESRERIAKATARYEAIVEAARELTLATVWMKSGSFDRLRAALAALDGQA